MAKIQIEYRIYRTGDRFWHQEYDEMVTPLRALCARYGVALPPGNFDDFNCSGGWLSVVGSIKRLATILFCNLGPMLETPRTGMLIEAVMVTELSYNIAVLVRAEEDLLRDKDDESAAE